MMPTLDSHILLLLMAQISTSAPEQGQAELYISPSKNAAQKKLEFHAKLLKAGFESNVNVEFFRDVRLNRRDGIIEYKRSPIARVEVFAGSPSKAWFSARDSNTVLEGGDYP